MLTNKISDALEFPLDDNTKKKKEIGRGMLQNIQSLISRLEKEHQCDSDYDCEHCFHDTCIEKIDRDDIIDELKEIIAPSLALERTEKDLLKMSEEYLMSPILPQEVIDEMLKASSNIVSNDTFVKDIMKKHDGTTARELVGYKVSEDGTQEPVFRDMTPEDGH